MISKEIYPKITDPTILKNFISSLINLNHYMYGRRAAAITIVCPNSEVQLIRESLSSIFTLERNRAYDQHIIELWVNKTTYSNILTTENTVKKIYLVGCNMSTSNISAIAENTKQIISNFDRYQLIIPVILNSNVEIFENIMSRVVL